MRSPPTATQPPPSQRRRFNLFRPSKSRKKTASDRLIQLRKLTRGSLVTVKDGTGNLRFLPAGRINDLTHDLDVRAILSYHHSATDDLISFVCNEAQRIFLSLVLQQIISADDMALIMKDCFEHRVNDKSLFPIECSDDGEPATSCNCPTIVHAHGSKWENVIYNLKVDQWSLLSPVFNTKQFIYKIPPKCVLPFSERDPAGKHGHFSTVHRAILHPDHLEMDGSRETFITDGAGAGIQVALKELKNIDEVKSNWYREVSCLEKLSHPHLVRSLAAIEQDPKHIIMFEWADSGSLRDVWNAQGPKPRDLDTNRITCFVEQLRGLAGALVAMHKPPSGTTPGTNDGGLGVIVTSPPSRTSRESRASSTQPRPATNSQSLQVPEVRVQGEISSDEGSFISDDPNQNTDVHWRHGDLKPDNILVFKAGTSSANWLGTLKIADLGLAKQHFLSTSNRIEPTGQRYTTSQYEAPEAMPGVREARSRKYDIWSMGCIILEFVILLLYGCEGLNAFYSEHKNDAHSTNTIYFTVTHPAQGLAEVSNIASHWIDNILQDRECTRQGDSALRDLVKLVRDKLLVVDLNPGPRSHGTCRIGADDLEKELEGILRKAERMSVGGPRRGGPCYLFGQSSRAGVPVPRPSGDKVTRSRSSRPQSMLGDDLPRTPRNQETYTHVRLDKTWDFPVDNEFAIEFLKTAKSDPVSFPSQLKCSVTRCADCSRLGRMAGSTGHKSTWSLRLEGGLMSPKRMDGGDGTSGCPARGLILQACSSLLRDADTKPPVIEIHRTRSNLFLRGYSSPLLSLRKWSASYFLNYDSLKKNPDIQIGLLDLAPDTKTPSSPYFELLSSWLKDCDQNHQQCRVHGAPRHPDRPFLPTRLLDVGQSHSTRVLLRETRQMTTDQLDGDIRYIALSHPWGEGNIDSHFCTTHQNVKSRKEGGVPDKSFPNTLQDAIQVTRALKIRYLWIDTLCIIQGNDGDFDTEAKLMEMVYSMAYLVLAASRATGMSTGFLLPRPPRKYIVLPPQSDGVENGSRREGAPEDRGTIYLCEAIDDFQKDVIDGPLNRRGWVLQERALARRTIYFTENQTYFECGAGVRCETLTKMTNDQAAFLGDPNFPAVAMKSTKGAKIRLYQSLCETYSALQFTKAYDRSIAIAGLEQRLIRAFNTQGGYGVFDTPSFGRTLLWKRDERVTPTMKPIVFPLEKKYYGVPTWSWMAYEGVITFMDLPFSGVEWRYAMEGVIPPWDLTAMTTRTTNLTVSSTDSTGWHTGRMDWSDNRGAVLKARARAITVPLNKVDAEKRIVYDAGKRPSRADAEGKGVKCVVIGREIGTFRASDEDIQDVLDSAREHYVLVVAPRGGGRICGDRISGDYVRIGVGTLPEGWIHQDSFEISVV